MTPEGKSGVKTVQPGAGGEPPVFGFPTLRPRAIAAMEPEISAAKIVTVTAPVGYGKTVLMAALINDRRKAGETAFWIGLDERDRSLERLVSLIEARLSPQATESYAPTSPLTATSPAEQRSHALLTGIRRLEGSVHLFIDNLDYCDDPGLGAFLDQLIFTTGSGLRLVVSSNRDLPLDRSRARLQGFLAQIGAAELNFSGEDIAALLGPALTAALEPAGIAETAQRTEGWPVAVRMAQIIFANSANLKAALRAFSGTDQELAHFLNRQVLSGFPPEIRGFLLAIAPLRSFSAELIAEVLPEPHAQLHLDFLLRHNALIIPLDRNGHWFRLHGLFRDFLLGEGARAPGGEARLGVLARAAQWCARNRLWADAIDYALESASPELASGILEQTARLFVRDHSNVQQYIRWVDRLYQCGHRIGPEGEYWYIWALCFRRRYDEARQRSIALAGLLEDEALDLGHGQRHDLLRRVAVLRASVESISDRCEEAHDLATHWLEGARAGYDETFDVTVTHVIRSCYFTNNLRFVEARQAISRAQAAAFQTDSPYVDARVATYAALIPIYEGDYTAIHPVLERTLDLARQRLNDEAGAFGMLALVAAKCAVEMGAAAEAERLFEFGLGASHSHGFLEATACGLDAGVKLWRGPGDERIPTSRLREIAAAYPPRLALMLACFLVRRLIVLGLFDEARLEAARIGLGSDGSLGLDRGRDVKGVAHLDALFSATRIDLLIADGRYKQAAPLVEEEMRRAKAAGCLSRRVELELCSATIAQRLRQESAAVRHVARAIRVATPHGIRRSFADYGQALAPIIANNKTSVWGFALQEEQQFFVAMCRTLPLADGALDARLAALEPDAGLCGQLTGREQTILRLVEAGLSNQQMADHSEISLTTVKWHLQNIYMKLGVGSRSAALARARAMRLLSS